MMIEMYVREGIDMFMYSVRFVLNSSTEEEWYIVVVYTAVTRCGELRRDQGC